jgi:DNA repair photolyase
MSPEGRPAAANAVTSRDAGKPGEVVVRETACKSILNRSALGDYSLNCYTGCAHACTYCYARYMQRFHPHPEPWGEFVDVKVNAVEVLKRQLRRLEPGEVFVSSACDGWQPIEAEYRLTRRCCELLVERGFQVNVLSKSALVRRDLELFSPGNATIGTTVTTLDERLRALWERGGAAVPERLGVLEEARRLGLTTSIMFGPLLPFLSDDPASITGLMERAGELGVSRVWVDALNPRPRVWPAVAQLLGRQFPDLREPYRKLLFEPATRKRYLAALRTRVARAAEQAGLTGRVSECF